MSKKFSILDSSLSLQGACYWQRDSLSGDSMALAIARMAKKQRLLVVLVQDARAARQLYNSVHFFLDEQSDRFFLELFPADGLLLYDHFLTDRKLTAQRLTLLGRLPDINKPGILITSVTTCMHRLPPIDYLGGYRFLIKRGDVLDRAALSRRLALSGYIRVSKVLEAGEFSIRGSIMDIFPLGSPVAYRIDWFGETIDEIFRINEPVGIEAHPQPSLTALTELNLLPTFEFPLHDEACRNFCKRWEEAFGQQACQNPSYQNVRQGQSSPGLQYYLPLFFQEKLACFWDYLPDNSALGQALWVTVGDIYRAATDYWKLADHRYQQYQGNHNRPLLPPRDLLIPVEQLFQYLKSQEQLIINSAKGKHHQKAAVSALTYPSGLSVSALLKYIRGEEYKLLLVVSSLGRLQYWSDRMLEQGIDLQQYANWDSFLESPVDWGIVVGDLRGSFKIDEHHLIVITEDDLLTYTHSEPAWLSRTTSKQQHNVASYDLDLHPGDLVVHQDHGIGRYAAIEKLVIDEQEAAYVLLHYADQDKLYVPIAALHLLSRYQAIDPSQVTLDGLGSKRWKNVKKKVGDRVHDVAAELLEVYAKRSVQSGHRYVIPDEYSAFSAAFPYRETPDQARAILDVIQDMKQPQSMDRLLCGDTGFGKTEVAMRAAFVAVQNGKQVAVLVPTTLLAQQHLESFQDRFANWPIRIDLLSRTVGKVQETEILDSLASGKIDILIGTHKLIQSAVKYHKLGLLIIDEEHRFGVRHKEHIRHLATGVDILTLSATPIPRTLYLSFCDLRDLSIIATPPDERLPVKTFVETYDNTLIRDAILRELTRGGQVYYIYNKVADINYRADQLAELFPEARIAVGHGQMHPKELEQVMYDFNQQRSNVLLATTILEAGIDIPNSNTIIIERADRFGLAQLHQLRGRVGRSHHQAYAYLLTPQDRFLGKDATRRLSVMTEMKSIGAGFTLAQHDLEIRGAGELLGKSQSGHMNAVGFSLYMEWLERAAKAIKHGKNASKKANVLIDDMPVINLSATALLPDDYVADVCDRLVFYRRIATATDLNELSAIRVELIDRFGDLPEAAQCLFGIHSLRCDLITRKVKQLDLTQSGGCIEFTAKSQIYVEKLIQLVQQSDQAYRLINQYCLKFSYPNGSITNDPTGEKRIAYAKKLLLSISSAEAV